MYPLLSLHRSPAAVVAEHLSGDPVASTAECARLRPMTTLPSSSSSETRTSTGAGVAAAVVVVVVVVVLAGMMKYRPIVRRTVAFAAPPTSPPSGAPSREIVIRWLGIGDCFLYYMHQQENKSVSSLKRLEGQGMG